MNDLIVALLATNMLEVVPLRSVSAVGPGPAALNNNVVAVKKGSGMARDDNREDTP